MGLIFSGVAQALCASAILTAVVGKVQVQHLGENSWIPAQNGMVLAAGDKVWTGRQSRALSLTERGVRILIKEKTVFQLSQLGPDDWTFEQKEGKARVTAPKLSAGQRLSVRTPTAVCAVRGTDFQVTVMSDQSTMLDVFEGVVGFKDAVNAAPEIPVEINQRSQVKSGQAPSSPQAVPEGVRQAAQQERIQVDKIQQREQPGLNQQGGQQPNERNRTSPEERKENTNGQEPPKEGGTKDQGKGGPGLERNGERGAGSNFASRELKAQFKSEVMREVGLDLHRESIESKAAFDLQSSQYEESKTLIDAFGQRVRLEEYVTRPSPESFKYVVLNHRDNRLDQGYFEVVANKSLPQNLEDAGNLWFSQGDTKPEFYAVKQRFYMTNSNDSVLAIALDGDSRRMTFQKPQFNSNGEITNVTNKIGFQTMFDHKYEFINGNPQALERLWIDTTFRPRDNGVLFGVSVSGMMWHMRPVFVEHFVPGQGAQYGYWVDTFLTNNGSGNTATGKFVISEYQTDPNIYLAKFRENQSYINFVDTNGNGRLDRGESFDDINRNGTWDPGEPFEDIAQFGLNGTPDNSRMFDGLGDTVYFSDKNRDGINNDGVSGSDPFGVARNPWARKSIENIIVSDDGQIADLRSLGLGDIGEGSNDQGRIGRAFEKLNFEQVMRSSEFADPVNGKIDVVLTPRVLLRAGVIQAQIRGNQPIDQRK